MMASVVALLASLPEPVARTLADEWQGALQQSAVDNPLGYLRQLIERHKAGTLILEHAPRIRAEREWRKRQQAATMRSMAPPSSPSEPQHPAPSAMPSNWRAGLYIPAAASRR